MRLKLEADMTVVGEAADGPAALLAADTLEPDVVVMDYEMAGMNGVQAAAALTAARNPCKVVMLSLYDDSALKVAASRAGVVAFITKHEPSENLMAAIRKAASATKEETS